MHVGERESEKERKRERGSKKERERERERGCIALKNLQVECNFFNSTPITRETT
jgi:hypothetical protein